MYVIHLLLPLSNNQGESFEARLFAQVRGELTERFGGVTAFLRSPGLGLWKEDAAAINRDEVVMFEVHADKLDRDWWTDYRTRLEEMFQQEELVIWAVEATRL